MEATLRSYPGDLKNFLQLADVGFQQGTIARVGFTNRGGAAPYEMEIHFITDEVVKKLFVSLPSCHYRSLNMQTLCNRSVMVRTNVAAASAHVVVHNPAAQAPMHLLQHSFGLSSRL